jgi:hypothetical protein
VRIIVVVEIITWRVGASPCRCWRCIEAATRFATSFLAADFVAGIGQPPRPPLIHHAIYPVFRRLRNLRHMADDGLEEGELRSLSPPPPPSSHQPRPRCKKGDEDGEEGEIVESAPVERHYKQPGVDSPRGSACSSPRSGLNAGNGFGTLGAAHISSWSKSSTSGGGDRDSRDRGVSPGRGPSSASGSASKVWNYQGRERLDRDALYEDERSRGFSSSKVSRRGRPGIPGGRWQGRGVGGSRAEDKFKVGPPAGGYAELVNPASHYPPSHQDYAPRGRPDRVLERERSSLPVQQRPGAGVGPGSPPSPEDRGLHRAPSWGRRNSWTGPGGPRGGGGRFAQNSNSWEDKPRASGGGGSGDWSDGLRAGSHREDGQRGRLEGPPRDGPGMERRGSTGSLGNVGMGGRFTPRDFEDRAPQPSHDGGPGGRFEGGRQGEADIPTRDRRPSFSRQSSWHQDMGGRGGRGRGREFQPPPPPEMDEFGRQRRTPSFTSSGDRDWEEDDEPARRQMPRTQSGYSISSDGSDRDHERVDRVRPAPLDMRDGAGPPPPPRRQFRPDHTSSPRSDRAGGSSAFNITHSSPHGSRLPPQQQSPSPQLLADRSAQPSAPPPPPPQPVFASQAIAPPVKKANLSREAPPQATPAIDLEKPDDTASSARVVARVSSGLFGLVGGSTSGVAGLVLGTSGPSQVSGSGSRGGVGSSITSGISSLAQKSIVSGIGGLASSSGGSRGTGLGELFQKSRLGGGSGVGAPPSQTADVKNPTPANDRPRLSWGMGLNKLEPKGSSGPLDAAPNAMQRGYSAPSNLGVSDSQQNLKETSVELAPPSRQSVDTMSAPEPLSVRSASSGSLTGTGRLGWGMGLGRSLSNAEPTLPADESEGEGPSEGSAPITAKAGAEIVPPSEASNDVLERPATSAPLSVLKESEIRESIPMRLPRPVVPGVLHGDGDFSMDVDEEEQAKMKEKQRKKKKKQLRRMRRASLEGEDVQRADSTAYNDGSSRKDFRRSSVGVSGDDEEVPTSRRLSKSALEENNDDGEEEMDLDAPFSAMPKPAESSGHSQRQKEPRTPTAMDEGAPPVKKKKPASDKKGKKHGASSPASPGVGGNSHKRRRSKDANSMESLQQVDHSILRVRDIIKRPAELDQAIQAMQDLRPLEGLRMVNRMPNAESPLPSAAIIQSGLQQVQAELSNLERMMNSEEPEIPPESVAEIEVASVKSLLSRVAAQVCSQGSLYTTTSVAEVENILAVNRCVAKIAKARAEIPQPPFSSVWQRLKHRPRLSEASRQLLLRPLVTKAIRKRRLAVRRRWENLGADYTHHADVWRARLAKVEAARAGGVNGGTTPRRMMSDVVRSDYEQDQILKELMAKEAMRVRIAHGGVAVPAMICEVERKQIPPFVDGRGPRLTTDGEQMYCVGLPLNQSCPPGCNCARAVERDSLRVNPWTDMEKCIFLDKFMQYPKNFGKIASFLRNKTTSDAVRFYYDSKQSIDYKEVLKEHAQRKRGMVGSWPATIGAAKCLGATVKMVTSAQGTDSILHPSVIVLLPTSDMSYKVTHAHPPARLATLAELKRAALDLSRKGVVRKIQAPLGLKGIKGGDLTGAQLDEIVVSPAVLNVAAYHLALERSPSLKGSPSPFRRSGTDASTVPGACGLSSALAHLSTKSKKGRGRPKEIKDKGGHGKTTVEEDMHISGSSGAGDNHANAPAAAKKGPGPGRRKKSNTSSDYEDVPPSGDRGPAHSAAVSAAASSSTPVSSGSGRGQKWNDAEKATFLDHFSQVGKNWHALASAIPGKTPSQIKNYYQNYKVRLGLNDILSDREARQKEQEQEQEQLQQQNDSGARRTNDEQGVEAEGKSGQHGSSAGTAYAANSMHPVQSSPLGLMLNMSERSAGGAPTAATANAAVPPHMHHGYPPNNLLHLATSAFGMNQYPVLSNHMGQWGYAHPQLSPAALHAMLDGQQGHFQHMGYPMMAMHHMSPHGADPYHHIQPGSSDAYHHMHPGSHLAYGMHHMLMAQHQHHHGVHHDGCSPEVHIHSNMHSSTGALPHRDADMQSVSHAPQMNNASDQPELMNASVAVKDGAKAAEPQKVISIEEERAKDGKKSDASEKDPSAGKQRGDSECRSGDESSDGLVEEGLSRSYGEASAASTNVSPIEKLHDGDDGREGDSQSQQTSDDGAGSGTASIPQSSTPPVKSAGSGAASIPQSSTPPVKSISDQGRKEDTTAVGTFAQNPDHPQGGGKLTVNEEAEPDLPSLAEKSDVPSSGDLDPSAIDTELVETQRVDSEQGVAPPAVAESEESPKQAPALSPAVAVTPACQSAQDQKPGVTSADCDDGSLAPQPSPSELIGGAKDENQSLKATGDSTGVARDVGDDKHMDEGPANMESHASEGVTVDSKSHLAPATKEEE